MKWAIPAKTFLVGEYVALTGGPAIILTTPPCFEVILSGNPGLDGIHKDSPAGKWWHRQDIQKFGLEWRDPYQGMGGMGASSAQFLGAFYASSYINNQKIDVNSIFDAYIDSAWSKDGIAPSGYDVIAQSMGGCVFLDRDKDLYDSCVWPFFDLGFILIHTGKKLATHDHLQKINILQRLDSLSQIVELAKLAFDNKYSVDFVNAVNSYHEELLEMDLVAMHSVAMINEIKKLDEILAIKGCGALGADVLLVITPSSSVYSKSQEFVSLGLNVIANSDYLVEKC